MDGYYSLPEDESESEDVLNGYIAYEDIYCNQSKDKSSARSLYRDVLSKKHDDGKKIDSVEYNRMLETLELVEFPSSETWIPFENREEYTTITTFNELTTFVEECIAPANKLPVKKNLTWYERHFDIISKNKHKIANATMLTIENIVMCVELFEKNNTLCSINIQKVANRYAWMGITLNQIKFPSVVFKYTPPIQAVQPVFASGRIVSTGSQTVLSAMLALEKTIHLLKDVCGPFEVGEPEIKNLVGTGTFPFKLDVKKVKDNLPNASRGKLYAAVVYKPKVEYEEDEEDESESSDDESEENTKYTTTNAKTQKKKKSCTLTFLLFPEGQYIVVGAVKQNVIIDQVTQLYHKLK